LRPFPIPLVYAGLVSNTSPPKLPFRYLTPFRFGTRYAWEPASPACGLPYWSQYPHRITLHEPKSSMNRVLITGATGFVGQHVVRSLIRSSRSVVAVVRPGRALPDGVERVETPDLFAETAEWWAEACHGIDTLVHLAWVAEPGKYLTDPRNYTCLSGTIALTTGAISAGVTRLVCVGSCFEYDLAHRVLSTATPLKPATPYAACKAAAYFVTAQIAAQGGVPCAWARLFYLYGEGEDPRRLVPFLHSRLARGELVELTEGLQIRDYMDVADAADALTQLAANRMSGAVNICSGKPITVRELCLHIAREYGREDLLRFGTRPENLVDPDCVLGIPTELLDTPRNRVLRNL
jgi:nucleoside-diphosphate-sugar epimerase